MGEEAPISTWNGSDHHQQRLGRRFRDKLCKSPVGTRDPRSRFGPIRGPSQRQRWRSLLCTCSFTTYQLHRPCDVLTGSPGTRNQNGFVEPGFIWWCLFHTSASRKDHKHNWLGMVVLPRRYIRRSFTPTSNLLRPRNSFHSSKKSIRRSLGERHLAAPRRMP